MSLSLISKRAAESVYLTVSCLSLRFSELFRYRWGCVISHGSALYLAGLSDRMPHALDVTVPHGYNPRGLVREHPDVRIHRVSQSIYEPGITEAKSPGGAMVRAYGAERAVADLISQRSPKKQIHSLCEMRCWAISRETVPISRSWRECAPRSVSRLSSRSI